MKKLLSANNYYPFGMLEPERNWAASKDYRYGYNGMEKDNMWDGKIGDNYDFGGDSYDAKICRRKGLDPEWKKGPGISPYSTFFNNPFLFNDTKGKWPAPIHAAMITNAAIKLKNEYGIRLSNDQIGWMIKGSLDADDWTKNQSTEKSYIHYMQDPAVTKGRQLKMPINGLMITLMNTQMVTKMKKLIWLLAELHIQ